MNSAIILLAAGASSRMGQAKQMLKIGSHSLLAHVAGIAVQSGLGPVIVVLGAHEEKTRAELKGLNLIVVDNPEWKTGMGSSIAAGMQHLSKQFPDLGSLVIMVCDQPLVSPSHLKKLFQEHDRSGKTIVASRYSGTAGVPALFHRSHFAEIENLVGDQGAKKIIRAHPAETAYLDFPDGAVDLDTPEDFTNFIQKRT